jgi:ACS family D-galactonate transporter-like MFS transporter
MSADTKSGIAPYQDAVVLTERRTRTRFMILALISGGTMINYLDRSVMGIAAPSISADLGLNAAMMGLIFSAFSWTYAASQIPGGILLDRLGTKLTYWLALTRGTMLPGQQPSGCHLVSATGAGAGDRYLYLRRVCRPGIP